MSDNGKRNLIPRTWKRDYNKILQLRVLGSSFKEIADITGYSRNQVMRISKMPKFKEMEKSILEGDGGNIVERTRQELATLLPTAVNTYGDVMEDENAHNRDKISAADSVMDRFIPKQRRDQVETSGSGMIVLNINVSKEELLESPSDAWLESPTQEAEYSIICSECKAEYKPGIGHECEPTSLTLPHHQPPKGY